MKCMVKCIIVDHILVVNIEDAPGLLIESFTETVLTWCFSQNKTLITEFKVDFIVDFP